MEYSSATSLLDKYFEGETTLLEERQLREYFSSNNVPPALEKFAPLFCAFSNESKVIYNIPLKAPVRKSTYTYVASVAAVAVIALVLWMQGVQNKTDISTNYASDEVAILKTKQALGVMSHMIANSTTQLEVVGEFDKASSKLFK